MSRCHPERPVPSTTYAPASPSSLPDQAQGSLLAALVLLAALLTAWPVLAAESGTSCAGEPDDGQRLACYDRIFRATPEHISSRVDEPASGEPAVVLDVARESSLLEKAWELGSKDKRGTFVVKTYQPNFLLPLHYTSRVNRSPSSPTHASTEAHDYRQTATKLQISLRAKVVENLLLPGADLWFAYTQRSLWQAWDRQDSSPFRSSDYQPEAIYVLPLSAEAGTLPLGWTARMLQLGIAHQSNGQSDPLSRSWNRIYLGAGLERGDLSLLLKVNQRLSERGSDDNPDLTDHIGHGEMTMLWSPGASTLAFTWRPSLDSIRRGSLQLDWTRPVLADQPDGLRWYAQLFSGYGETLLDYNHRQTSLGLGVSLFQF